MSESRDIPEGYKATELGVLPEEWDTVRIIEVADFTRKPRSISINPNQVLPFIPMEMIPDSNDSVIHWPEKKFSEISSGTFVFKGDLIVAKITPCFENGKQAILDNLSTDYAYTTTEVWPMHPKDNRLFIDFLANYLRDKTVRRELTAKMEGSTNRQRLPREALQNLLIPLPPLPEQNAIATTLRTVQEAKEKTDAVIAATKALKASMMKHLFTYGPVPPEDAENVALKETEIGQVPEWWKVINLGDICNFKTGKLNSNQAIEGGKYPFFTCSKDIFRIDSHSFDCEAIMLSGNNANAIYDVKYYNGKFDVYQRTYVITIKNLELLCYHFLLPALEMKLEELRVGSIGSQTKYLTMKMLLNLKISLPPLPDQNQIATILSSIDQKLAAEQSRKEALDTLFASLLHDLMTAKIRVSAA